MSSVSSESFYGAKSVPMTLQAQTNTRRRLALLFSVPLAFGLLFFGISLLGEHTDLSLLRIHNLSSSIVQLRSSANDLESGERGYLLTGDERFLVPFNQAQAALPTQIQACERYLQDYPAPLQERINRLISLVHERSLKAQKVVEAKRSQQAGAALQMAQSNGSETVMDAIRRNMEELRKELDAVQQEHLDRQRTLNHWAFLLFAAGMITMITVMVSLYGRTVSYLHERDVADQQRDAAAEELRSLNAELESRVEARTRDLQLVNDELQQFAYVASHDLQEPLRTITSFTQLLASRYKGHLDEDADEFIGYIVTSSRRMSDLINGLLALVRLRKSGQVSVPIAFETILKEAEGNLQASIRDSRAEITHSPLPTLLVDPLQFAQVFQNLISNALKYGRAIPVCVRIEASRDANDWTFSISDNGLGFDQQFAERIFGLFQRLHSREVDGTGMGLSIARKVVQRHGGRMWAESKEGIGSTFYFSLPVALEPAKETIGPKLAKSAAS